MRNIKSKYINKRYHAKTNDILKFKNNETTNKYNRKRIE